MMQSHGVYQPNLLFVAVFLQVGGLKEKLLAAQRAGLRQAIVPARSMSQIQADVPATVLAKLQVLPVQSIEQALVHAFDPPLHLLPKARL